MKQFFNWPILLITLQLFILGEVFALKNATCAVDLCKERNTSRPHSASVFARKIKQCNCDEECTIYGECCIDALNKTKAPFKPRFDCVEIKLSQYGVAMRRSCSMGNESDNESITSAKCSLSKDLTDQMANFTMKVPATASNGMTYGNKFCAICNNATNYTEWNIRFSCDSTSHDAEFNTTQFNLNSTRNKYIYNDTLQQWTYVDGNITETCTVRTVPSRKLRRSLKKCHPQLVTDCPTNAPREYIEKCSNYTSIVKYKNGTWFKNEYCALCNNISSVDLICDKLYSNSSISNRKSSTKKSSSTTKSTSSTTTSTPSTTTSTSSTTQSTTSTTQSTTSTTQSTTSSTVLTPNIITRHSRTTQSNPNSGQDQNSTPQIREFLHITVRQNCSDLLDSLMLRRLTVETKTYKTMKRTHLKDSNLLSAYPVRICRDSKANKIQPKVPEESFVLKWVVNLGVITSILFASLYIYHFLFSNSDPTKTRRIFACYVVTLIIGNIALLASNIVQDFCHFLGSVTYFSFLTSFCWLSALAFDASCKLWRCLQETDVFDKNSSSKKFTFYSLLCWISPLIIAFIMAYGALVNGGFVSGGEIYKTCWFQNDEMFSTFFIFPLAIMVSINGAFYLFSAYVVSEQRSSVAKLFAKHGIDFYFHTALIITSNLMWSTVLIAMYNKSSLLWLCFACLDVTLGLLVYISSPVKHALSNRITSYFDKCFIPVDENLTKE